MSRSLHCSADSLCRCAVPVAWAELSTIFCVLSQGENLCHMQEEDLLPDDDHNLGGISAWLRNHSRPSSQTADPWIVISHPEERKWTSLSLSNGRTCTIQEFEDIVPTRSYHELDSSSTSHRLAEIDQAKSLQDLVNVGSLFGSTRMSFETAFPNCERPREDHEFWT